MPTPLYDLLKTLAGRDLLRLDMPGHHGRPLPYGLPWPAELDCTENGLTGDLFGDGRDAIARAEELWAERFGFDSCLFLTGGSTQGVHAGLALLAGAGGHIALDRGAHRSAYNALALLDLTPHYLSRPWLEKEGVAGPVDPNEVERLLSDRPEIKTVCITSPTYYGVLSDIPAIAAVCHAHGARLMVDSAHGAHLPFLGYEGYPAADAVVMSAHKTLPAPGQTALLFANGSSLDDLRRVGSVYGSSSPSYVMMAALDLVRDYMEREGAEKYRATVRAISALRGKYLALTARPGLSLDPARLTLLCGDGFALADRLRAQGCLSELSDRGHVVFICTCADGPEQFARLDKLLAAEDRSSPAKCPPPPGLPPAALTPRQALFAPRKAVALGASEGCISAGQIAPYPPGVPVVAPGEVITKKTLAYLRQIGYNKESVDVICP